MGKVVRVADYIFSVVAKHGVRSVFLVPGGGSMFLVDALAQNADLAYVPSHHEQASAVAAEAYAKVSGKFGVVLVTTGPGATNAITGITGAWLESIPVLVISGQVKRADLMGESGLRQKGPQEVDILPMVRPITKYAVTVMDPNEIRYHLEKAIYLATTGRGGPVWIDVPLDVQAAPIDPETLVGYNPELPSSSSAKSRAIEQAARDVLSALSDSKRPLLLAGHGIRLGGASYSFVELYETLGIPVATTWPVLDLIDADHPLCVGRPGTVAQRAPNFVVQNCDFLLTIGTRLDNSITAFNLPKFGRNAHRFVVDIDAAELAKFGEDVVTIEADAGEFMRALLDAFEPAKKPDRSEWLASCAKWKRAFPVGEGDAMASSGTITHYQFVRALSDALPAEKLVVTGSSGLAIEFFFLAFQNKARQRILTASGSLGAMGFGLPAMVGAGVAYGGPFVGVESDGSFMFNMQELLTLKALEIPVAIFVMNNDGYASIRNTQRNYFEGRYIASGRSSKLLMADTVAVATALGIPAMRIEDASELRVGIELALAADRLFICDVRLESEASLWPKSAAVTTPDGSMVSMPLEDMTPLLTREQLRANMLVPLDPASELVKD